MKKTYIVILYLGCSDGVSNIWVTEFVHVVFLYHDKRHLRREPMQSTAQRLNLLFFASRSMNSHYYLYLLPTTTKRLLRLTSPMPRASHTSYRENTNPTTCKTNTESTLCLTTSTICSCNKRSFQPPIKYTQCKPTIKFPQLSLLATTNSPSNFAAQRVQLFLSFNRHFLQSFSVINLRPAHFPHKSANTISHTQVLTKAII